MLSPKTSLKRRLIITASLMLAVFLFFAAWLIEEVYERASKVAIEGKLSAHVDTLLALADDSENELWFPEIVREERFNLPDSNLWGYVWQDSSLVWRSLSTVERGQPQTCEVPYAEERFFETDDSFYLCASFPWEFLDDSEKEYRFVVAESKQTFNETLSVFRKRLGFSLLGLGIALVITQIIVLNWGLLPLQKVAHALKDIESGKSRSIEGEFPKEISILSDSINGLLDSLSEQMRRYKDSASDLAHSLKTPLAVLRSELVKSSVDKTLTNQQIQRIDQIIAYQLQRAVIHGNTTLQEPSPVAPILRQVTQALEKVYWQKAPNIAVDCHNKALFYGEEGDLMECLGNLIDNACKFCKSQVKITVIDDLFEQQLIRKLVIRVEDDGPGIRAEIKQQVLQRGSREDLSLEGQGIGLAMVSELAKAYQAELQLDDSPLGGASISLTFSTQLYRYDS